MYNQNINEILQEVAKETENKLLEQLNDFISRGLIVVENGPMTMIHDSHSFKVLIQRSVQLVLKDKEYILKLENENGALKELLKQIKSNMKDII